MQYQRGCAVALPSRNTSCFTRKLQTSRCVFCPEVVAMYRPLEGKPSEGSPGLPGSAASSHAPTLRSGSTNIVPAEVSGTGANPATALSRHASSRPFYLGLVHHRRGGHPSPL